MDLTAFQTAMAQRFKESLKPLMVSQGRKSAGDTGKTTPAAKGDDEELSISKFLLGVHFNHWVGAAKEQAAYEDAKKQMGENLGVTGGYIVPPQIFAQIIELLRGKAVMRSMNPMVIPRCKSNTVEIPKLTGGSTAYWVGENKPKTPSQPELGMLEIILKELATLVKCSNALLEDSTPAADRIIKEDMASGLAFEEDNGFINGTGGVMPLGILNWPLVPRSTFVLANRFNSLMDAMTAIETANSPYTAWLMHPRSKNTLRQVVDTANRYIWDDRTPAKIGAVHKEPGVADLLGLPVFLSTQIPTNIVHAGVANRSLLILGNWPDFVIADKGAMTLKASEEAETAFRYNQTWFRAVKRTACGLRHAEAFHIIEGMP